MRKTSAILLGIFTLLISLKTSIGMHYCHDALVETSINRQLSDCCKKSSTNQQANINKQCCEIDYIAAAFDEIVPPLADVELTTLVAFTPVLPFEIAPLESTNTQHFTWREPPPESPHVALHLLFEQYLI